MRTPARRLPPLDLLQTFDAAARHLSFTRAGEERFITQSAVSRQMRALEDELGVQLFRRGHRSLELTPQGRLLAQACAEAIGRLRTTVDRLRTPPSRRVLTLTTTPGLASLWLIPRLSRFTRAHPGVDVRIDASFEQRDLDRDGIDVAIRFGRANHNEGTKLFDQEVLPVCSPSLLAAGPPLKDTGDLARHTLLRLDDTERVDGPMLEWQPWLAAMGVPDLEPGAMLMFSNYDEVIAAAVHGQGVALGRRPLVDALLAEGRLVAPIGGSMASPRTYFVVVNLNSANLDVARELADWLVDEARAAKRDLRATPARGTLTASPPAHAEPAPTRTDP